MWLSNETLSWIPWSESFVINDDASWLRAHDLFKHAEQHIVNPVVDLNLVDGLTSLKRSMDHRLRQLRLQYLFDDIPINSKPKRILDQLAYFGIIRPLMLENLIKIRNEIEHADAVPPDEARCREFVDFIWYFLRSTDKLVRNIPTAILLYPIGEIAGDPDRWIEIRTEPEKKWVLCCSGVVDSTMLSTREEKDWLHLEVDSATRINDLDQALLAKGNGIGEYFVGTIIGPVEGIRGVISRYFMSF